VNHPLLLCLLTLAGVYTARLWRDDLRAAGRPGAPRPLPGATPASRRAVGIAVAGALLLLAFETAGEFALGLADQQSRMTWLFALYSVTSAPVIEELIFRGWLVIENRGRWVMWAGAAAASAGFALLHPFLWNWNGSSFAVTLTAKGWFSSGVVFAMSLWLYAARLAPWNPRRSLLPCFAAHAAKNAGVVLVKAAGGYMGGLF
jgi:uncharacterized protein